MSTVATSPEIRLSLRKSVTCPHCWHQYASEDTLWVAEHPELQNDPKLGSEGLRFLPTRFDVEGNAIDPMGTPCRQLACPHCHLRVPRPIFEIPPMFLSIAGTPSCGKTYFLASMTWKLRHTLPKFFSMAFTDADPVSNLELNNYENDQFFNPDPEALVKLAKTEEQGVLYNTVVFGEQFVSFPKPFLFSIRPRPNHPNYAQSGRISRLLSLYDNAGESFEPRKDASTVSTTVTGHLAQAQVLLFCFDPTQDPRLRARCTGSSQDPQIILGLETRRQEAVFHEMVDRIRRLTGLHRNQKHTQPLIVVVTKYDVWWPLVGEERPDDPFLKARGSELHALDMPRIEEFSRRVRDMLWEFTPELVSAAEEFTDHVLYIPVSATGCGPEYDQEAKQVLGIRPKNINPIWTEIPLLTALARFGGGMIPFKVDSP